MSTAAKLKIRVIPNARKTEFSGSRGDEIVLRLNAPAMEGRANAAAVEFLSRFFGVSRSAVVIIGGERSRHKIIEIVGLKNGDLERKLAQLIR
ncbi:MAG: hypothetical protein AUH28_08605 [Acidobacteria bacterium 13_1_40CM_56_16]|nr:MAG: hypothetical protein AUH28_08605 [Acidobacteria bacterium 13_1_40CM_56_16]OLD68286.1 MAG: hypothetical protein AUI45_11070 [Acidobacteria bacterium 13_1_40CM_2_56_11]